MDLNLRTNLQCQIADMLWSCATVEEVERVVNTYGHEARAIQMLMLYTAIDQEVTEPSKETELLIRRIARGK